MILICLFDIHRMFLESQTSVVSPIKPYHQGQYPVIIDNEFEDDVFT